MERLRKIDNRHSEREIECGRKYLIELYIKDMLFPEIAHSGFTRKVSESIFIQYIKIHTIQMSACERRNHDKN